MNTQKRNLILNALLIYFIMLLSFKSFAQINEFESIKGNPHSYHEIKYKAEKVKNEYIKTEKIDSALYVKDSNTIYNRKTIFPNEIWDSPQIKYSKSKKKIQEINYDENGKIINKTDFIYDKNDNLIEENFYNDFDSLKGHKKYEYSNNLKSKLKEYTVENGKFTSNIYSETTYQYDSKENLIQEIQIYEGEKNSITYKYNDHNLIVEHLRQLSFPNQDKEPKLYLKYVYKKYDTYNWTELFFEETIDNEGTEEINIYFIERIYNY
jgi:hypothetical protein